MNKKINLILASLATTLAMVFTPALAQEEEAAASSSTSSPAWSCHRKSNADFNLLCIASCADADGNYTPTNADGEEVLGWDCPNSDVRKECAAYPCSSEEDCAAMGIDDFGECHNNGRAECKRQAQAATGARCVPPADDGAS